MKRTIIFSCLLLLIGQAALAQQTDGHRLAVPLSDPGRPVVLHVSLMSGSITVRAQQGLDEVVVVASPRLSRMREDHEGDEDHGRGTGGMRRIPNTSMGLTVEEDQNTIQVSSDWTNRTVDLEITVPVQTSMRLSSVNNGELLVDGVRGELELQNTNGGIEATNVGGSVVANTTNGDVLVRFVEITSDKAMSFTTFNGDVDVTFPGGARGNLRLSPGQGEIYTDMDVQIEPREPKVERSEGGGSYRIRIEEEVRGKLGGGGPEFHFKTFNGDIILRKAG